MNNKNYIIGLLMALLLPSLKAPAQINGEFILKDEYDGIVDERSGRRFIEMIVHDSTQNIDTYMSSIYTTLLENYPDANIQLIGTRVIKMDATSKGISAFEENGLKAYLDFSITFEARDHVEDMWEGMDEARRRDIPCIRVMAPTIKKLTVYNPYIHPEIKVYRTSKNEIMGFLLSDVPVYGNVGQEFLSEVSMYIIHNINVELNRHYFRDNYPQYPQLTEKNHRLAY